MKVTSILGEDVRTFTDFVGDMIEKFEIPKEYDQYSMVGANKNIDFKNRVSLAHTFYCEHIITESDFVSPPKPIFDSFLGYGDGNPYKEKFKKEKEEWENHQPLFLGEWEIKTGTFTIDQTTFSGGNHLIINGCVVWAFGSKDQTLDTFTRETKGLGLKLNPKFELK